MIKRTLALGITCIALGLAGCSGAEILLKIPVSEGCKEIPLKECDELTDGILLYVEGKQDEAKPRIAKATTANSPTELRRFAAILQALRRIPGADEYMKPVFEIAEFVNYQANQTEMAQLTRQSAQPQSQPVTGLAVTPPTVSASGPPVPLVATVQVPSTPLGPARAFTADTDPRQLDTGAIAPTSSPSRGPCGPILGAPATVCARAVDGPFVITDVHVSSECDAAVFVGATSPSGLGAPRWVLAGKQALAGSRLLVRKDETLIIGVPDGKIKADPRCVVTWAGFRPYSDP